MKHGIEIAEREFIQALGLGPEKPRAWKRYDLTKEERSEVRHWRYLRDSGQCSPEECARAKAAIEQASREQYEAINPPWPKRLRRAVNKYAKVRPVIARNGGLTPRAAKIIVDEVSTKAVQKRKARKGYRKQARQVAKLDAKDRTPALLSFPIKYEEKEDFDYVDAPNHKKMEKGGFGVHRKGSNPWLDEKQMRAEGIRLPGAYSAWGKFNPKWYRAMSEQQKLDRARARIVGLLSAKSGY